MKQTLFLIALALANICYAADTLTVTSPQGTNIVRVWQQADGIVYDVQHNGHQLLAPSRLGLDLDNHTWERALARKYPQYDCWMLGFTVDSLHQGDEHRATIQNLYGEQAAVPDNYNSGTMHLGKHDGSNYRLDIEVRAYDEGVAFRYFLPEHPMAVFHKVTKDLTEYTFAPGTKVWAAEWAQAPYELKDINDVRAPIERAVTVQLPNGQYCALADADVDDWCLERNVASTERRNTLATTMYSPVDIVTYYATPWKVIITGETYGQLLEHRFIIDNLNPPSEVPDAAEWVKPGKIFRCTQLTTEAGLKGIDFCAKHNIPYMLFDWKWYDPCTSHDGDATKVIPQLDMQRIVAYGREKGVGIWLYVNQHALQKQMEELFPLLHEWGVVGVKSGFVQYASHRWATWVHDMVRLAAKNHLMINIHDEFRPAGFSRTYPNLLNQEGIRGNEEFPDATHNTVLPFTRMINGAADYTICYFDKRLKVTHGHQLAASMVYYGPLQVLFWYDTPDRVQNTPELAWFDQLPTVWDETRVLEGTPGSHIVIARRKGSDWYVAAMTNTEARTVNISTDFLPAGKYGVTIYNDDPTLDTPTKVRTTQRTIIVGSSSRRKGRGGGSLTLQLQPSGGATLQIVPLI